MTTKELEKIDTIAREQIPAVMFEFFDTLNKIKNLTSVLEVCFTQKMADIYVVLEKDDVDLSEHIMESFAQWEATYKVFPELHIINKDEKFYIPNGSYAL